MLNDICVLDFAQRRENSFWDSVETVRENLIIIIIIIVIIIIIIIVNIIIIIIMFSISQLLSWMAVRYLS